ncbi:MAG: hypothetical protein ABSF83_16105 [Nitrososphaerales archaeon]
MDARKIFAITIALSKSQLRASRSGASGWGFLRRPSIILILDAIAFAVALGIGYVADTFIQALDTVSSSGANIQLYSQIVNGFKELMVFIPVLVPGMVLIAGVLFELNVSAKFSGSDTVNWLPITQTEYVIASALSVAYNYSLTVAIVLGLTLAPAIGMGLGWLWVGMTLTSVFTLFTGGSLVEILRATMNRVGSIVAKRARRGAFVFRLALMALVVLAFETVFNPALLIVVVNGLSGTFSAFVFVPIFWGAVAVQAIATGQTLRVVLFSAGTVAFTAALVWVATKVRSRYWSPVAFAVTITSSEYAPRTSSLRRLGMTGTEAAIVKKDLKGITRRRELSSILIIPIIFTAIFLFEGFANSQIGGGGASSPISASQILRAKAFVALVLSLGATFAVLAIFSVISRAAPLMVAENALIAGSIAVEEVAIGLAFGARFPDFQEKPRPRFVDPIWLLVMTVVGFAVALATSIPVLYSYVAGTVPGLSTPVYLYPAAVIFAGVITFVFYRFAGTSVRALMAEYAV